MTRLPAEAGSDIVGWYNRGDIVLAMMADSYYRNYFTPVGYQMMWNAIVDLDNTISFPIDHRYIYDQGLDRNLNNRIKENIKRGLKANKKWYKYGFDRFCIALDGGAVFLKRGVYEISYGDGQVNQYTHTFVEQIDYETKLPGGDILTNYKFPDTDLIYEDDEMKIYSSDKSQIWIRIK